MKIILVFILLFISVFSSNSKGNPEDSLVYFLELTYHSDLEKEAFQEYFENKNEGYFNIFMSFGDKETLEQQDKYSKIVINFVQELAENIKDKKDNKKVKYVFKAVHNKFLKKYELKSYFHEIFEKGYYNCVSASILYGLIFDELEIEYNVKISPNHVYLVAYPKTYSILIETTNPLKGYTFFEYNTKNQFVTFLKNSKLISGEEYRNSSVDELFKKYYFQEENSNLNNLIGTQYLNDGIVKIEDQNFLEAFIQFEKAYLFYPSKKTEYLLFLSGSAAFEKLNMDDKEYPVLLYKLARYKNYGISKDEIVGEFVRITEHLLFYEGNHFKYDSIYNFISLKIQDKELENEIDFIYNYEKSRFLAKKNKYKEAFVFVKKAYELKPKNPDIESLFVYAIISDMESINKLEERLEYLEECEKKYKNLKDSKLFSEAKFSVYLGLVIYYFKNHREKSGLKYLQLFELDFNSEEKSLLLENYIENAYSSASFYYYKKGYYSKAKSVLKKGLEYLPGNWNLEKKLRAVSK